MLVINRKFGKSIQIGEITITVVGQNGRQVRLGIEAPPDIFILRTELKNESKFRAATRKRRDEETCGSRSTIEPTRN